MIYFSDEALLKGLRNKRTDCIRQLYREFFPLAKSIVERNSGSHQDAEDVFQDSLIILYEKVAADSLDFKCSLKTYFYAICKNIWMQRLDRKWRLLYQDEFVHEPSAEYEPEIILPVSEEKIERKRLYQEHFIRLPKDCQILITMYLKRFSYKEIAKRMSLKNEAYAKTRKYLCKNMLRKKIQRDPRYKMCMLYEEQRKNP